MKLRNLKIATLLFIPLCLNAGDIPEYRIVSIERNEITLDNGTKVKLERITPEWHSGDKVVLQYGLNFPPSVMIRNGLPVSLPSLSLTHASLHKSIKINDFENLGEVFRITALDKQTGMVTLSDTSVWEVRPSDHRLFDIWSVGDQILVGKNGGADSTSFEGILFDWRTLNLAIVNKAS